MTKKFTLTKGVDDKKFEFIYQGFLIGGTLTQQKGLPVLRRELSILTKLEAISKDCECGKKVIGEEISRDLTGGVLELEGAEFDLLYNYVSAVPWTTGKAVKEAVATIDWLANSASV